MSGISGFFGRLFGQERARTPARATVIQAPSPIPMTPDDPRPRLFLSGSTGQSEHWQGRMVRELADMDVVILNPRRDDWDSSWREEADDPQFRRQVEWELQALEASQLVVMCFDAKSESPVTLLEFGLYARSGRLIVVCPDGFWRKGNVDVTAQYYGVKQVASFEALVAAARAALAR